MSARAEASAATGHASHDGDFNAAQTPTSRKGKVTRGGGAKTGICHPHLPFGDTSSCCHRSPEVLRGHKEFLLRSVPFLANNLEGSETGRHRDVLYGRRENLRADATWKAWESGRVRAFDLSARARPRPTSERYPTWDSGTERSHRVTVSE